MILVHITTVNEERAMEIVNSLQKDKLILDAQIINSIKVILKDNKPHKESNYLILAKTKALLFNAIDEVLRLKYGDDLPSLYSIPIVQMDWNQSKVLRDNTAKV